MKTLLHIFSLLFLAFLGCKAFDFDDGNKWLRSVLELSKIFPPDESELSVPPSCGKKAAECDPKEKYYRIDGSCNNLDYPEWGLPNSTYSRLLPPAFSDGISAPRMANDQSPLPGARRVRVTLFPSGSKEDSVRSLVAMQWGQIVTHDMSLQRDPPESRCCTDDAKMQDNLSKFCFPIKICPHDPVLGSTMSCMNFSRSMTDKDLGCSASEKSPARQINVVTPWMDLSIVYDIESGRSNDLRSNVDGLLKVLIKDGNAFPPEELEDAESCRCNQAGETRCFKGGDSRMNQSPHLILLQIILLREHNRLATELKKINPQWNDEKLFQEARRINIGQTQHISYYEWMPTILGYDNLVENEIIFPFAKSYVDDYNPSLSPDVSNEHAHAAFRHFHSQIAEMLRLMNDDRNVTSSINIGQFLHRPGLLEQNDNFQSISRGLLTQPSEDADELNIPAITDHMFLCNADKYGSDLRAFDIQRDRDHAMRYYNDYRELCGIGEARHFRDFGDFISKKNINKLRSLYKSPYDVDLSVGGGLEKKFRGAQVGPTFLCIIMEQFKRTRQADRFWFEHREAGFTKDQLKELRKSSLSRLFCDNEKSITKIQRNAFLRAKDYRKDLVPCSFIPIVDLQKWKE